MTSCVGLTMGKGECRRKMERRERPKCYHWRQGSVLYISVRIKRTIKRFTCTGIARYPDLTDARDCGRNMKILATIFPAVAINSHRGIPCWIFCDICLLSAFCEVVHFGQKKLHLMETLMELMEFALTSCAYIHPFIIITTVRCYPVQRPVHAYDYPNYPNQSRINILCKLGIECMVRRRNMSSTKFGDLEN